jgi:glycosyltransferase involved in cell wall biosynthesis
VRTARRFKVGVVANEFFQLELGRLGGFGWAARRIADVLRHSAPDVDLVYFTGELRRTDTKRETMVGGTRLLLRQSSLRADIRRARAERPDVLLLIDYRPNYRWLCWALPRTPIIVWVRDPRPPDDVAKVHTLRIPGTNGLRPKSTLQPDCSSLGTIARVSRLLRRPVWFAGTASYLGAKLSRMLRMEIPEFSFLPNPVDLPVGDRTKASRPRVAFLARLDPYKRPWLYVDLARRFPDVEFLMAGHAHYRGEGAWEPTDLPSNLRILGHVDGPSKVDLLRSAWVLVNTSIHEGLAVSMLEALACETPLLACVDPGGLVSQFGVFAGRFDGDGLDALPSLEAGLGRLLRHTDVRRRLGSEGRQWVTRTHNPETFLTAFRLLCTKAGASGALLGADRREDGLPDIGVQAAIRR